MELWLGTFMSNFKNDSKFLSEMGDIRLEQRDDCTYALLFMGGYETFEHFGVLSGSGLLLDIHTHTHA